MTTNKKRSQPTTPEPEPLTFTFTGMLRAYLDDGLSARDAAEAVMESGQFHDQIRTALTAQATRLVRTENRAAERRAVTAWRRGETETARSELLGRSFALPDGRFVEWSTATADEHRSRASWQIQRAESIKEDAHMHAVAAQVIEEAGVTCLGEIVSIAPWPKSVTLKVAELSQVVKFTDHVTQ